MATGLFFVGFIAICIGLYVIWQGYNLDDSLRNKAMAYLAAECSLYPTKVGIIDGEMEMLVGSRPAGAHALISMHITKSFWLAGVLIVAVLIAFVVAALAEEMYNPNIIFVLTWFAALYLVFYKVVIAGTRDLKQMGDTAAAWLRLAKFDELEKENIDDIELELNQDMLASQSNIKWTQRIGYLALILFAIAYFVVDNIQAYANPIVVCFGLLFSKCVFHVYRLKVTVIALSAILRVNKA